MTTRRWGTSATGCGPNPWTARALAALTAILWARSTASRTWWSSWLRRRVGLARRVWPNPRWSHGWTGHSGNTSLPLRRLLLLVIASILGCSMVMNRLTTLISHVILKEWLYPLRAHIFIIHQSGVLTVVLACCRRLGASSVDTIQPCTSLQHHFIQSHICRVYVCLAVTCHLHFWQNDWDLLCASVVTQGCNGYQNKSQHRKLTPEKKICPQLLRGLEPRTYWSQVWHHWTIPAPHT